MREFQGRAALSQVGNSGAPPRKARARSNRGRVGGYGERNAGATPCPLAHGALGEAYLSISMAPPSGCRKRELRGRRRKCQDMSSGRDPVPIRLCSLDGFLRESGPIPALTRRA